MTSFSSFPVGYGGPSSPVVIVVCLLFFFSARSSRCPPGLQLPRSDNNRSLNLLRLFLRKVSKVLQQSMYSRVKSKGPMDVVSESKGPLDNPNPNCDRGSDNTTVFPCSKECCQDKRKCHQQNRYVSMFQPQFTLCLLLWMLMLTKQSSYLYVLVTHSVIHVDEISTKIIKLKKLSLMSRIKLGSITTTSRSRGTFGVSKRLEKLKRRRYTHKGGIQLRQLELAVRRNRGPDGFPGWGTVVLLKRRRYTHKGGIQLRQLELAVVSNVPIMPSWCLWFPTGCRRRTVRPGLRSKESPMDCHLEKTHVKF